MKKILLLTISLVFGISLAAEAQNCDAAIVTTEPATFTAIDEVKLLIDVSGCPVIAGLDEVYLWPFIEGCCDAAGVGGNGDFCNGSNPALQMTDEGNNVYSFTFVPQELFSRSPGEIASAGGEIGLIAKRFAGDCNNSGDQTENLFIDVQPLEFLPQEARSFPLTVVQDQPMTLFFDANETANDALAAASEIYTFLGWSGTDAAGSNVAFEARVPWGDVGSDPSMQLESQGGGIYTITFIPQEFFGLTDEAEMNTLFYKFRTASGDQSIPAGENNFEATFTPRESIVVE